MGLIDSIRRKLPIGGEPEADLTVEDFENFDPSGGDGDGEEDGANGEDGEQNGDGAGGDGEQGEDEENGSGSGDGEDDGEDGEQNGDGAGGDGEQGEEDGEDGEQDGEGDGSEGDGSEQGSESGEDDGDGNGDGEGNDEGDENGEGNDEGDENGDSNSGGSGGDGKTNEAHNLSEEEREELKSEMDEASAERDMSEWFDTTSNYEEPTQFIKNYYENLQEERAEPETEIEKRKRDRDERVESLYTKVDAQHVVDEYDKRFADEIREAFRKIKTRSAPKPAEYGQRINMRGVIRRRSGDPTEERLYMEMEPSEAGDRCITVIIDGSGSMDSLEIKLALMALADACEQIGDRFAATMYDTQDTPFGNSATVRTHLITAPDEDFKNEHLDSFKAHGYTPTASGIEDGRAIADITPNSEDVLIVVTDGVANVCRDGRVCDDNNYQNSAMKEARKQVNAAINEGKRVIGLGVGEHLENEAMREIFGPSYVRADMDEMAESLVDIYREQMKTDSS